MYNLQQVGKYKKGKVHLEQATKAQGGVEV